MLCVGVWHYHNCAPLVLQDKGFGRDGTSDVNTEVKVHRTAEQKYISLKVDGPGELVSGRGSARGITPSLLRRSIKKLTWLSCFANLDFVTQVFDSTRQALRGSLLIGAYEIECSEIAIRCLIAQQIIGDGKD